MAKAISERTPQIIAAEINSIKDQTGRMLLYSSVEIGRRLTEAKSMVNHGEWGKWLENSVSYSQSTANKLMRLFEEYGAKLTVGHQDSSNSESITNLSYTQAIILLGIPEEERESF
ncbi:MAG: membrane protein, partial [Peptococcaceae bacterium BRH_c23]